MVSIKYLVTTATTVATGCAVQCKLNAEMASFMREAAITSRCAIMEVVKLKDEQKEAITSFVACSDEIVILPTGYKKSMCLALLPLCSTAWKVKEKASIIICISPLTSLMQMEQRIMFSHGLTAEFVGELQTDPRPMRNVDE